MKLMPLQVQASKKTELKKHVFTIHCSNLLSLLERKAFNALLYNAYHDLPSKSQFTITSAKLSQLIGYNSNDTQRLKDALRTLVSTVIEWNVIDNTKQNSSTFWQASSALSAIKMENGLFIYEYSEAMRKNLYHPEMYGRIDMAIIGKFKSNYALVLYENCIRYQGLTYTPWLALTVFKKLMGVSENKYPAIKDFKLRVLTPAIKEINQLTGILVLPEFKKNGRKIEGVRFSIQAQSTKIQSSLVRHSEDETVQILSAVFQLSPESIGELCATYDLSYIKSKIELILQSNSYKSGKIKSLSGYLVNAIKQNHQPTVSSQSMLELDRDKKYHITRDKQRKEEAETEMNRQYTAYKSKYIKSTFSSLSQEEQDDIVGRFISQVVQNNDIYCSWYKKGGLNSVPITAIFNVYLEKNVPSLFSAIKSFEQYIEEFQECSL